MRFLVTIDGSELGVGMPPERLAQVIDRMVIPGIAKLHQWEQEGRAHGGGYTAARGGAFPHPDQELRDLHSMHRANRNGKPRSFNQHHSARAGAPGLRYPGSLAYRLLCGCAATRL